MTLDELIASITPDIYQRIKRAVEIGKWDNGAPLSDEQREQCLQAIIVYDDKHKSESERVGYVEPKPHTQCDEPADEWQKINIKPD